MEKYFSFGDIFCLVEGVIPRWKCLELKGNIFFNCWQSQLRYKLLQFLFCQLLQKWKCPGQNLCSPQRQCDARGCACDLLRHGLMFAPSPRYQHSAALCNTLQHTATQHTATYCNTLQHTATHCTGLRVRVSSRAATHCNTLQHTATYCTDLRARVSSCVATHCNTLHTLQHTATHCITLQHTATHCNTTS